MNRGVNGERNEVPEAIDGASEEVEARAEVGDGGGGEGGDGGEDRGGFSGEGRVVGFGVGGEREVANERGCVGQRRGMR